MYDVFLHNSGLASAKEVFAIVATEPPGCSVENPQTVNKMLTEFGAGLFCMIPLHPSGIIKLCSIRRRSRVASEIGNRGHKAIPYDCSLLISLRLFALDMQPAHIAIQVGEDDVLMKTQVDGHPSE